jgi:anaerobic selenocysteine-containing dehydrogenase
VEGFEEFMTLARPWTIDRAAEACGLAAADVARFADWYATITPSSISVGNGLERNRNGGSGIRAVLALPALAGRFAVAAAASSTAPRSRSPRRRRSLAGRTWCHRAPAP